MDCPFFSLDLSELFENCFDSENTTLDLTILNNFEYADLYCLLLAAYINGLMTLEAQAKIDANTCRTGYFTSSSKTFTNISGKKHKTKQINIININLVSRLSSLSRRLFRLSFFVVDCL
jgi:hypothetical protein